MSSSFIDSVKNSFNSVLKDNSDTSGICCCNTSQKEALIVIGVTAVITGILWRSALFAPIKLVAVFLHEFSHASATWITCGKVTKIEVNENFGGVTTSRGGIRWITLSAGYTGSVVWGAFFILMTWDKLPTRIASVVFMVSCIVTAFVLRVQDKRLCGMKCAFGLTMRFLILLLAVIPGALWVLEEKVEMKVHPLRWCMLIIGTVCTLHALYDCVHDALCRKIDNDTQGSSDAVMFANELFGTARCWGLLWSLIALIAVAAALFGVIMLNANDNCKL